MNFRVEASNDFVDLVNEDEICIASVFRRSNGEWKPVGEDMQNMYGLSFRTPKAALAYVLSTKGLDFWYSKIGEVE